MKNALLGLPLLAAGVLAAGCAAASSSSAGSASSPSGAASTSAAATGAGMSQNHIGLQLRNIGSASCTVYGYPGVSWVAGADGHQVGAAAARQLDGSGSAEKTVTLAPGGLASAPLDNVDAAVITKSQCKPVPVRGLRVYPPGETAALFLSMPTAAGGYGECSLTTKEPTLLIGYLQAGAQPGSGEAS